MQNNILLKKTHNIFNIITLPNVQITAYLLITYLLNMRIRFSPHTSGSLLAPQRHTASSHHTAHDDKI